MPKFLPLPLYLLALLATGGCSLNSLEDYPYSEYATVKPVAADVVGTWAPDAATSEDMKTRGGYTVTFHRIIINADGTYSMINMPDWIFDGVQANTKNVSHKKFFSATGKWHFEKFQDWWAIVFENGTPTNPGEYDTLAHVCYDRPPHLLHFVLSHESEGDDGEEAARFEKR